MIKNCSTELLIQYKPRAIINFAAETHVDRSIHHPEHFINTNIKGTFTFLEAARKYWVRTERRRKKPISIFACLN